ETNRVRRIGALMAYTSNDPEGRTRAEAFEQGLRESGWIPDQNIRIDYFWPGGEVDRIRTFANELAAKRPDGAREVNGRFLSSSVALMGKRFRTVHFGRAIRFGAIDVNGFPHRSTDCFQ